MANIKYSNYNDYTFTSSSDNDNKRYYYIYKHLEHFRNANGINTFYNIQGKSKQDEYYKKMKTRYSNNFIKSIKGDFTSIGQVAGAAIQTKDEEAFIKMVSESAREQVQEMFNNSSKINELLPTMKNAYDAIKKEVSLESMGNLLMYIRKGVELLEADGDEIGNLVTILNSEQNLENISEELNKQITNNIEKKEGKVISLSQNAANNIAKAAKNIIDRYLGKEKVEGGDIKKSINSSLKVIFSTQLGETLAALVATRARKGCIKTAQEVVTGGLAITRGGDSKCTANFIEEYGQRGSQTFKVDSKWKNATLTIQDGEEITMDLGFSIKTQKDININSKDTGLSSSSAIHLTNESNGGLLSRLKQICNNKEEYLWASQNAIGLNSKDTDRAMMHNMRRSLLLRNLDTIVAGTGLVKKGETDLAHFIVINGVAISIWDLILYAASYSGADSSENSDNDVFATSFGGNLKKSNEVFQKAWTGGKLENTYVAYQRAKKQNELIEQMDFSVSFQPSKLLNLKYPKVVT